MILGAGGHLGIALQKQLSPLPRVVVIPVFGPRTERLGMGPRRVDVTDRGALRELIRVERPDAIVHLAGVTGAACAAAPDRAFDVNVRSVETVADVGGELGVEVVVFPSTSAVYGDEYTEPVSESAELNTKSLYAETKARAEDILRERSLAAIGPRAVILRIFNVYGSGLKESLVERLLNSTPADPVPLRGLDVFSRDYSSVTDIARVMESALFMADDTRCVTLNIGSGVATSNRQLLEVLSRDRRVYSTVTDGAWSYSCADLTQARRFLTHLPEGLV